MASKLDLSRIVLELHSVAYGRAQSQFRIAEHQDNIDRLKPTLTDQLAKEAELIEKIKALEAELNSGA